MSNYTKTVMESQKQISDARSTLHSLINRQNRMCADLASLRQDYTVTDVESFREETARMRREIASKLEQAYESHDIAVRLIEEHVRKVHDMPTREEEAEEQMSEWSAASQAIDERVAAAVAERDPDNVGTGMIYSAYGLKDGIPQDNLDTVFAHGSYWVKVEGCDYFGNGESYQSEATVTDPTMLDLAIHANASIPVTGDRHHCFFEGARVTAIPGSWDEPGTIVLHFGS